jgi:hypothetical protein
MKVIKLIVMLSLFLSLVTNCRKKTDRQSSYTHKIEGTLMDSCDGNPVADAQVFITLFKTEKIQGKDSIIQETIQCKTQNTGYFSVNLKYRPIRCSIYGVLNKQSRFLVDGQISEKYFENGVFSVNQIYLHGMSVKSNLRINNDSSFKQGDIIVIYDLNPPYEDHRDTIRGKPGKFWDFQLKIWYKWNYLEKDPVTQNWIFKTPYYLKRIRGNDTLMTGVILENSTCLSKLTDTIQINFP